jgi:PHD/YefM family antitoxin component YafN of YafNO toxin-antitoxin module
MDLEKDLIDVKTMRKNLNQIVDEVSRDHAQKVIIKNDRSAALLVNVSDYQALQDRLLALELQMGLQETIEADKRGELFDWDETVAELGIELSDEEPEKPEGYEQMIPERYRSPY